MAPLLFLLLSLALPILAIPLPAKADGGIAMSGSFYRQSYVIPQGSSVRGLEVNVTVYNTSTTEDLRVRMIPTAPDGITIRLTGSGIDLGVPTDDFVLPAGAQRQLLVAIEVASYVAPDTYPIMISAEGWDAGTGLTLLGSAAEQASVTVTGEGATVVLDTVAPGGEPVVGTIRLFRVVDSVTYECAFSTTGHLEARVTPGHYLVWAEMNGTKQEGTEQSFDLVANEEKSLSLTIEIIYFEAFAVNPAYHPQTNELGYVQITYTVNNVYQQVDSAEVRLVVTLNGSLLEEIAGILSVSPLNVGRIGMPYEYTPAWGWEDGTYGFSLRLLINGEQYASTNEQTLEVGVPGGTSSLLFIIAGIIGGGLLLGILVLAVTRRRKRGEKPEKAAKKKAKAKVEKKAKAKGEAPAPAEPAPGVEVLFGRGAPELKDAESAPGLAKTEASAPPKEVVRPAASTAAPTAPKPVVEKPAGAKPSLATGPAGVAKETAPPSAPAPTPVPKPSQPPTGVKPAEAKPVQPAGAPRPPDTAKPAPAAPHTGRAVPEPGLAKPVTPPAPPKAGEPPVPKPAGPAAPQPPLARPMPPAEAPKSAPQPAAPKVTEPPPATETVRPAPPQPATGKPPAERESARPPQGVPPGHIEKVAAPGAGVEADSLRQMPAEKAAGKPDLRVVSALEQRMSRVRKESRPDSAKPAGEGQPGSEAKPAATPESRAASDKPAQGEAPVSATEPPAKEPVGESPVTSGPVPDNHQPTDEETPAEPTSPEEGQKVEEADEAGKGGEAGKAGEGDSDKTDKKFTSPIRFLNQ